MSEKNRAFDHRHYTDWRRPEELDPRYVDAIIDRWQTFTGEKAVLLNG